MDRVAEKNEPSPVRNAMLPPTLPTSEGSEYGQQSMESMLQEAVLINNLIMAQTLIKAGANVNGLADPPAHRVTPIVMALSHQRMEMARLLLEHGAILPPQHMARLLYYSRYHSDTSIAALVLQYAGPNHPALQCTECEGETPLHGACDQNNLELIRLLLKYGSDVHVCDQTGSTPLFKCKSVEAVTLLYDQGARLDATDKSGRTVLHVLCQQPKCLGFANILHWYVEHGANINALDVFQRTPLHWAANRGDREMVRLLLGNQAILNVQDLHGDSPLHLAVATYHHDRIEATTDLVKLMLEKGASPQIANQQGSTPLHLACTADNQCIYLAYLLLCHGAQVNAQDSQKRTPLHLTRNFEMARFLLESHADPNASDHCGQTPLQAILHPRRRYRKTLWIQLFANHGLDGSQPCQGFCTLWHFLASHPHCGVSPECLTRVRGSMLTRDEQGRTALHVAIHSGHVELVEWMVEHAPQTLSACDDQGMPPVLMARNLPVRTIYAMFRRWPLLSGDA